MAGRQDGRPGIYRRVIAENSIRPLIVQRGLASLVEAPHVAIDGRCRAELSISPISAQDPRAVRSNDRSPPMHGRCIDLSRASSNAIGMGGTVRVRVGYVRAPCQLEQLAKYAGCKRPMSADARRQPSSWRCSAGTPYRKMWPYIYGADA